jgi:hypothetical protein
MAKGKRDALRGIAISTPINYATGRVHAPSYDGTE